MIRRLLKKFHEVSVKLREIPPSRYLCFLKRKNQEMAVEFIKFCLVGSSGLIVDLTFVFISMQIFLNLAIMSDLLCFRVARVVGFVCALTSNFLLNRTFTFANATKANIYQQYMYYVIVAVSAFTINWSISVNLHENTFFFNTHYLMAALMGSIGGTLINFTGSKFIVFNN
jgi:putative flippase GtrA